MTCEQIKDKLLLELSPNAYTSIADDMYDILAALEKQIPKQLISEGNDESDWVHCPCCDEILGVNEGAYNSFYENNWRPIYCHKCGQAIIWN